MSQHRIQEIQIRSPLVQFVQAKVFCQRFQFIFRKDRCALRHMPVACPIPGTFRPPSGLKSRMQLPHIVQKRQNGKALHDRWSKYITDHPLNAGAERGQGNNAFKTGCNICTMMSKMMRTSAGDVGFAPRGFTHCSKRSSRYFSQLAGHFLTSSISMLASCVQFYFATSRIWTRLRVASSTIYFSPAKRSTRDGSCRSAHMMGSKM